MNHPRCIFLVVVICLLGVSTHASANMMDLYGFGPRASAMGMAYTGLAEDADSIYYNPAGIVLPKTNTVFAGYFIADPNLELDLTPYDGASDEEQRAVKRLANGQADVTEVNGYTLGATFRIRPWLGVGVGVFAPEGLVVRLQPVSSRQPTFKFHENYSQRTVVLVAAAVKPIESLSIGVGVSIFADVHGRFSLPMALSNDNVSLNPNEPSERLPDPDPEFTIEFPAFLSPYGGVRWQPLDWFSVGGTYRGAFRWDITMDVDANVSMESFKIDLADLKELAPDLFPIEALISIDIPSLGRSIDVPFTLSGLEGELILDLNLGLAASLAIIDFWKPQEAALGAAFKIGKNITLTADGVWLNWSAMPKPDMKIEVDDINVSLATLPSMLTAKIESVSVPLLGTIGPLPDISIGLPAISMDLNIPLDLAGAYQPRTHDIISPRIGFEYQFDPSKKIRFLDKVSGAVRAGYAYHPSPFSKPNGFSNLIVMDRHVGTIGGGVHMFKIVTFDIFGQYHHLVPIEADRDFVDTLYPFTKMKASGHVLAGGASVKVEW